MKKKLTILIMTVLLCMALIGGSAGVLAFAETGNGVGASSDINGGEEIDTSADVLINTINYNGSYVNYTLAPGRYRFVLYGARGGRGGAVNGNYSQGGTGAVVTTYYTTNNNMTFTFSGGGTPGVSSTGGYWYYNGGRRAGYGGYGANNNYGGGGGGATAISIGGTLIAIAGGGGGGAGGSQGGSSSSNSQSAGYNGGSTSGTNGGSGNGGSGYSGGPGYGALQTGGGSGGARGTYSYYSSRDGNYYPPGGGGGGAGYYGGGGGGGSSVRGRSGANAGAGGAGSHLSGGAGGSACGGYYAWYSGIAGSGGGGSSWVNTSYCDSTSYSSGSTGNGYIQIYRVNTAPATRNYTYSAVTRGTWTGYVPVTSLASDTDAWPTMTIVGGVYEDAGLTNSASEFMNVQLNSNGANNQLRIQPIRYFAKRVFYIKVQDNLGTWTAISFYAASSNQAMTYKTSTAMGQLVRLGPSNTTAISDFTTNSLIYNPNGTGRRTVFVSKPIILNQYVDISSNNVLFSDPDTYDRCLIKGVSTPSTSYYRVDYEEPQRGAYNRIRIKAIGKAPNASYIVLTMTVASIEENSNATMESTTLDLVFKVSNTRPYFATHTLNTKNQTEPFFNMKAGQSSKIYLKNFIYDQDSNVNTFTGAVKVPTNEMYFVSKENLNDITLKAGSNYNKGAAVSNTYLTGEGNTPTGFARGGGNLVLATSHANAAYADVLYSFGSDGTGAFIELKAQYATRNWYTAAGRTGDYYIMVQVNDEGDPYNQTNGDTGIWFPIAIKVNETAPNEYNVKPVIEGNRGDVKYLSPLTAGGVAIGGSASDKLNGDGIVTALANDVDNFQYAFVSGTDSANSVYGRAVNEMTYIKSLPASIYEDEFFKVEKAPLYAYTSIFRMLPAAEKTAAGIQPLSTNPSISTFNGLKVTLKKSTEKKFFEITVGVSDARGTANDNIRFLVKVNNTPLTQRTEANPLGGISQYKNGKFVYDISVTNAGDAPLYITPYDLAADADTTDNITISNSNPFNGGAYTAMAASVLNSVKNVKMADAVTGAVTSKAFMRNSLAFGAEPMYPEYITLKSGTKDGLPVYIIEGKIRTLKSTPVQLTLKVTDGNVTIDVPVVINVINSLPTLIPEKDVVYYMKADPMGGNSNVSGSSGSAVSYNVREFKINDLVTDHDLTDISGLSFFDREVRVVSYLNNSWETGYTLDGKSINLNDYVEAAIESGEGVNAGYQVIKIYAKSCTQQLPHGVFIEFKITDRFGTGSYEDSGSTLRIQVEVENSAPYLNSEIFKETERDGIKSSTWEIAPYSDTDAKTARYLVSDARLIEALRLDSQHSKLLVKDFDKMQHIILDPMDYSKTPTVRFLDTKSAADVKGAEFESNSTYAVIRNDPYSANKPSNAISIIYYDKDFNEIRIEDNKPNAPYWMIHVNAAVKDVTFGTVDLKLRVCDDGDTRGLKTSFNGRRTYDAGGVSIPNFADTDSKLENNSMRVTILTKGIIDNHDTYRNSATDTKPSYATEEAFKYMYFGLDANGDKVFPTDQQYAFSYKPLSVSSNSSFPLLVPVSYFAMQGTLSANVDAAGKPINNYVGFKNMSDVLSNLTLTDGKTIWKGATLNDNPFIGISSLCTMSGNAPTGFNDGQIESAFGSGTLNPFLYVGGSFLTSKEVSDMKKFCENTFGLSIQKKSVRTSSALRMTVNVMSYEAGGSQISGSEKTVTVEVNVKNSSVGITDATVNVPNDRDVPYTMFSGPITFQLAREGETGIPSTNRAIRYKDSDFINLTGTSQINPLYSDAAYFKLDSIGNASDYITSLTQAELDFIKNSANGGRPNGVDLKDYFRCESGCDGTNHTLGYVANPHYSDYFTVSQVTGSSKTLTITPVRKTIIKLPARAEGAKYTSDQITAINTELEARGLALEEYKNPSDNKYSYRIYYPFRILAYDALNGSVMTAGTYISLSINIYIENTAPTLSPNIKTGSGNVYEMSLSKFKTAEDKVKINLTDFIIDSDMKMTEANGVKSFMTRDQLIAAYGDNSLNFETSDYLEDVTVTCTERTEGFDYRKYFEITVFNTAGNTSIEFKALERTKLASVPFEVTFTDSTGAKLTQKFKIKTINTYPEINPDLEYEIKMRAGDSFTVFATAWDNFDSLKNEGYSSTKYFNDSFMANLNASGVNYKLADFNDFEYDTSNLADRNQHLGYLALATDDIPLTLRMSANSPIDTGIAALEAKNIYPLRAEGTSDTKTYPLGWKILAKSGIERQAVNFVIDDKETGTKTRSVTFYVTVVSTPPAAYTQAYLTDNNITLGKGLSLGLNEGEFKLEMTYGQTVEFELANFAYDLDTGTAGQMWMYPGYLGGSYFDINAASTQYVKATAGQGSDVTGKSNKFTLQCTNVHSDYTSSASVKFIIMDSVGENPNDDGVEITLYITTKASEVVNKTIATDKPVTVVSRVEYDTNLEPTEYRLVGNSNVAGTGSSPIIDNDYGASLTSYAVSVYALLKEVDGSEPVKYNNVSFTDNIEGVNIFDRNGDISSEGENAFLIKKLYYLNDIPVVEDSTSDIASYASYFFSVSFGDNGSSLMFIPKIKGSFNIFVSVTKNLGSVDNIDIKSGVRLKLTVDNSKPIATEEIEANNNFYLGSSFLYFEGVANSPAREYHIMNETDSNCGLFFDFDAVSGDDLVTYSRWYVADQYTINGTSYPTNPGWKKSDRQKQAFEVTSSNGKILKLQIVRKIQSAEAVVYVPLVIVAKDKSGVESENTVLIGIKNSVPSFKVVNSSENKGYSVEKVEDTENFILKATLSKGIQFDINLNDIMSDGDYADDSYKFISNDIDDKSLSDISSNPAKRHKVKSEQSEDLFEISTIDSNKKLTVSGISALRGSSGIAYLMVADSSHTTAINSCTSKLTLELTVGNLAPVAKSLDERVINIMGGLEPVAKKISIFDFVTDDNPGDMKNKGDGSNTYLIVNKITLKDPEVATGTPPTDKDGNPLEKYNILSATIFADPTGVNEQFMSVTGEIDLYGKQVITVTVIDNGGEHGEGAGINDGIAVTFDIVVNVAKPAEGTELNKVGITWLHSKIITPELLLDTEVNPKASLGYAVASVTIDSGYEGKVEVKQDNGKWSIKSNRDSKDLKSIPVTVTFTVGGEPYETAAPLRFMLDIDANRAPALNTSLYNIPKGDMQPGNTYTFTTRTLFNDDDNVDTEVKFVEARSNQSVLISADIINNELILQFKARGSAEITVKVTDLTNNATTLSFTVINENLDPPNFFISLIAKVQTNVLLYSLIAGGVLLFIILLIVIICVAKKKAKMRREIEALLASEMELEEQMLKLSSGQTFYQSYGYLPPTQNVQNNPGFMLGQGTDLTNHNAIGLNPGEQGHTQMKDDNLDDL